MSGTCESSSTFYSILGRDLTLRLTLCVKQRWQYGQTWHLSANRSDANGEDTHVRAFARVGSSVCVEVVLLGKHLGASGNVAAETLPLWLSTTSLCLETRYGQGPRTDSRVDGLHTWVSLATSFFSSVCTTSAWFEGPRISRLASITRMTLSMAVLNW